MSGFDSSEQTIYPNLAMDGVLRTLTPLLAIFALPILFWPTVILVVAIVKQARAEMILKPKHIAIFIAVQVIWLILILGLSYSIILKPLNLRI